MVNYVQMAKSKTPVTIIFPCCIGLAITVLCVLLWAGFRKSRMDVKAVSARGPLDPGVRVRDMGSQRQKCTTCEDQSGVQGGVGKCLTCQGPSFKYLTETIIAEQGAAANGACLGCRGAP